jgi:ATP-dependent Clp protease ATP-binding subunit ClpX
MAYRHVRRIKRLYLEGRDRSEVLPKSNYLLTGPTGCGKTYVVELLFREILQLPTVIVDVTTYSETGYVGQDPNQILTRLVHAANDNPLMAAIGIVCLDEFDKLASGKNNAVFAGGGTTKDVTGLGVQRELLKMLESAEVVVPLEFGHGSSVETVVLSTADISFVAAGAFSGFQQVVGQKSRNDRIGFGRTNAGFTPVNEIAYTLTVDEVEDITNFQNYGFLPELIARFTRIVPFEALSRDTLRSLLRETVLRRMVAEFEDEQLELVVDDDVVEAIVEDSIRRETGARGLTSILTRQIEDAAFASFGRGLVGRVRVWMEGGKIRAMRG